MTEERKIRIKNVVATVAVLIGLVVWYIDAHYWFSPFSKSYAGDWHNCVSTKTDGATHFECKEGIITLHMKETSK